METPESYHLSERHIYGSSRIGMITEKVEYAYTYSNNAMVAINENDFAVEDRIDVVFTTTLGFRQYELSNHLGNVLSVIGDQKLPIVQSGVVQSFVAYIISSQDYSPSGATLSGRSLSGKEYRYGFNGKEIEKEISGTKSHTSAEFWMYDARLGLRWEIDPLFDAFPYSSGYSTNFNSPLTFNDPQGDCPWCAIAHWAFQGFNNLAQGKSLYDSFYGDVDFLSVATNLIPGEKAFYKGVRILAQFIEITPNKAVVTKDASQVITGKMASKAAGKMRKGLEKMSSNKTFQKVEQRMTKSQNNLKKAEDKLKKNPTSERAKQKVNKAEKKLEESTEIHKETKKMNEVFGKLDDSAWDTMEKTIEKTIEESTKVEPNPKETLCPHF